MICHLYMLMYGTHPILCNDIHYIDSHPKTLNPNTTKSASMLLEIEKHLKIANASKSAQRTIDAYFVSWN